MYIVYHIWIHTCNKEKFYSFHSDGQKLADRLQTARSFQSAAMKRGIECEVVAAQAYSEVN